MLSFGSVFRLVRPVNAAIAFLAVISGAASVAKMPIGLETLLGAVSASLVLMSGNAINDVFDLSADKINRPERPLPRGDLSVRQAAGISLMLASVALTLALLINLKCFLVAFFYAAVFFAYAAWLKPTGLLGNVVVSSGTGMSIIYGSLTVGWPHLLTIFFAVCAFMLNLGREIVKGVEDLPGDRARHCKTVAITHGPRVAGLAVSVLYGVLLPLSVTPFFLGFAGLPYLFSILAADSVVFAVIREATTLTVEKASRVSRLIKISMTMGIVAFFVGSIWR